MNNITDVDAFTDPVTVLEDGDAVDETSTLPTIQALANRTFYLLTKLGGAAAVVLGKIIITALSGNNDAINGTGSGSGRGVKGTSGATDGAIGVEGISGATNGIGGKFTGTGTGVALTVVKGSGASNAIAADGGALLSAGNVQASAGQVIANTGLKALVSGNGSDALVGFISQGSATPSVKGSGTAGTFTYQTQRFIRYTRINNLVIFDMRIDFTHTSGAVGNLVITGFPYSIKDDTMTVSNGTPSIGVMWGLGAVAPDGHLTGYPAGASTEALPHTSDANFVNAAMTGDPTSIMAWGHYYTDDAF